jgi:hypothetical protein
MAPLNDKTYFQHLPALDLSIERHTDNVPHDGAWYVRRDGEVVGKFKTQKAAKAAYDGVIEATGWKPEKIELSPEETLLRETQMREDERFHDYWNNSHKFRARGGVHKNR